MSVSVALIQDNSEQMERQLCNEKQFREFRRWTNLHGEYPTINSFPLRYTGGKYRAVFAYNDEKTQKLLHELVDLADKTAGMFDVPDIYNHIMYTIMELVTEALKAELILVVI